MSITEAQREANKRYFAKSWSQVKLSMPNDEAAALRDYCAAHGLTVAGFIRGLIRDAIAAGDPVQAAGADPVQVAPIPVGDSDGAGVGRVTSVNTEK